MTETVSDQIGEAVTMLKRIPRLLLGLVAVFSLSCSLFASYNETQIPTTSSAMTAAPEAQKITTLVSATQGGTVTLSDGATVRISPGTLRNDTEVILQVVQDGGLTLQSPDTTITVGKIYEINLGPDQLEETVTLEIPFDPKLLPSDVEPAQVFLATFDEKSGTWLYAGGTVDLNRNVITLPITHASIWKPASWNWGAWVAILNKTLRLSIVETIESINLLTAGCEQTGKYVRVEIRQVQNLLQACIDKDDPNRPALRLANSRSIFYEVFSISGGGDYPPRTLLAPGDSLSFEANTNDLSPLVVTAQITQESSWYLVAHMIITMLPGLNQFKFPGQQIACLTERLKDFNYITSVVEALYVSHNGAAAAESLSQFYLDKDAMQRFIKAADDCKFGPAPTWSLEGFRQIGAATSTILSATDYIATYLSGNVYGEVAFLWTSPSVATAMARDDGKVYLGNTVILDVAQENLGCFGVGEIAYSPTGEYFLVVLQCFEGDNDAFLFRADGSDKRRVTGEWDYINYYNYKWSSDGQSFTYERINSCCKEPPSNAPPVGLVRYDIRTGKKTLLVTPTPPLLPYRVVDVESNDVLNVRSGPGIENPIVGTIPPNGTDIQVTGTGEQNGNDIWVPIKYQEITGWVNSSYLTLQSSP
jgi:hypothetical protein